MALESIDVTLTRAMYHKPSRNNPAGVPFLIARTSGGATIKGEMRKPVEYQLYRLWGEWRAQKGYDQPAFEFVQHEAIIDESPSGLAMYLTQHVDLLGPVKSRALVDEFGADTLKVLRETPGDALRVKGVTPEIVESIRKHFAEQLTIDPAAYARLVEMFAGHKIPRKIINSLLKDWGSDAPGKLEESPYMLLAYPRMGWKTVDAFAVSSAKYPRDGVDRHKWAIVEAVERITGQGHTFGSIVQVEEVGFPLIDARPSEDAWHAALGESLIVQNDPGDGWGVGYSLPKVAEAEETIAARLATLAASAAPLPFPLDDAGLLAGQQEALRLIESNGVVILAGAPGTGKTYTITRALAGLVKNGVNSIRIVTPTGKAAKRAAELLTSALPGAPIECSTIHRALEPIPSEAPEGVPAADAKINRGREGFAFARNADRPLEVQILVADEWSMADVSIAADLFRATAAGTRVVLVGDPNQLPSVGPGSVLRDLIAAGVPTATLTEIQRNSGRIVRACHDIMAGKAPEPARRLDLAAGDNWIHLEIDDPAAIAERIVELHKTTKTFDPVWDMQVISPEKAKPGVGCRDLNRLLSDALNVWKRTNAPVAPAEEGGYEPEFLCGDKIVRTKNGLCDLMTRIGADDTEARTDWTWDGDRWSLTETDVVNGDMGDVVDIVTSKDDVFVVVQFRNPDRLCRLPYGSSHLTAAYAMTCHKAQGSGFPYVILPVHNSFYFNVRTGEGLWNREMIYTMFSRAEKLLVTVGQFAAIESAVKRRTVGQRRTRLRGLVASPAAGLLDGKNGSESFMGELANV